MIRTGAVHALPVHVDCHTSSTEEGDRPLENVSVKPSSEMCGNPSNDVTSFGGEPSIAPDDQTPADRVARQISAEAEPDASRAK
jgi:hypothetical protein